VGSDFVSSVDVFFFLFSSMICVRVVLFFSSLLFFFERLLDAVGLIHHAIPLRRTIPLLPPWCLLEPKARAPWRWTAPALLVSSCFVRLALHFLLNFLLFLGFCYRLAGFGHYPTPFVHFCCSFLASSAGGLPFTRCNGLLRPSVLFFVSLSFCQLLLRFRRRGLSAISAIVTHRFRTRESAPFRVFFFFLYPFWRLPGFPEGLCEVHDRSLFSISSPPPPPHPLFPVSFFFPTKLPAAFDALVFFFFFCPLAITRLLFPLRRALRIEVGA